MKHKPVLVNVAIYRLHVVVYIAASIDEIMEDAKKAKINPDQFTADWKDCVSGAMKTAEGLCIHFGNGNADILIWLREIPTTASTYGPLWHELSHAVDKIAKHADPNSYFYDDRMMSEPRAFLFEYLACEITKDLWNRSPVSRKKN